MQELDYVRKELKAAQKRKEWTAIAATTKLTRTTFYNILDKLHKPNSATIEVLSKYFKRLAK